jgi:acetolactate synthase-1/2/3 large subunit
VTGVLAKFAPHAKVIHLDVDPAEVGKLRPAEVAVIGELRNSLTSLTGERYGSDDWRNACRESKKTHVWDYGMPGDGVYAPRMLRDLAAAAPKDAIVACDVGQHQMWVAQHYPFAHPTQHLTSGGLGTMGFGLPAAIGAQFARPDRTVINVSGDGSFMMNVQELATVRRYGLPIKIIVIDNQCLGMVRQWQELFLDRRYSEVDLSDNPDFTRVAESFGIPAFRLDRAADTAGAIERLLNTPGPLLAHVVIDREANVWPFIPPGKPNEEMMEAPCTP